MSHQTGKKPKPTLTFIPEDWFYQARCAQDDVDPEIFFVEGGNSYDAHLARSICRSCPVQQQCLEYALRAPMRLEGIWGGTGVKRREQLRKGYPKPDVFQHGTESGARRHNRRGEKPCESCLKAARLAKAMRIERQRREPA